MRWTDRQRAMLREMGIELPSPPAVAKGGPAARGPKALADRVRALPDEPDDVRTLAEDGQDDEAAPATGPSAEIARWRSSAQPPARAEPRSVEPAHHHAGHAGTDRAQLQAAVASCTACGLHTGRRRAVFGSGPARADWLIIGEPPGEAEELDDDPFAGSAGVLLDNMLRAIGLSRGESVAPSDRDGVVDPAQRAFATNALKCRPPQGRSPRADELLACKSHLLAQIEVLQPKVVLAMGRWASQALLGADEPIGQLRGRVHRYSGIPVVVTFHPAFLLRHPQIKARAWEDLCLARDAVTAWTTP